MTRELPPNPRGEALVRELRWVHDMIRRDLRTVRALAAGLAAGLPGGDAAATIRLLEVNGPLWQLRVNCLQYCRIVHAHHHHESVHRPGPAADVGAIAGQRLDPDRIREQ